MSLNLWYIFEAFTNTNSDFIHAWLLWCMKFSLLCWRWEVLESGLSGAALSFCRTAAAASVQLESDAVSGWMRTSSGPVEFSLERAEGQSGHGWMIILLLAVDFFTVSWAAKLHRLRNVKTFDQSLFRAGDYGAPNICRFDFLRKNNWERKHWADEPSLVTKYKKNINSLLALNTIP